MGIEFKFFEAGHGDSILVSTYKKNEDGEKEYKTHILIDGGVEATYKKEILSDISNLEKLDLVVLTHSLKKQWDKKDNQKLRECNGREFTDVARSEPPIDKREIFDLESTCINRFDDFFGTDTSYTNKSSIAFILKYQDKKFLLLGDADIKIVVQSLKDLGYRKEDDKRLEVEFVKLSHHGSANNINSEFLDLVKTDTYIVLTDGMYPNTKYRHPDKEALALILTHKKRAENIKFMFNNYLPIKNKFPDELNEEDDYQFEADKQNTWCSDYDS